MDIVVVTKEKRPRAAVAVLGYFGWSILLIFQLIWISGIHAREVLGKCCSSRAQRKDWLLHQLDKKNLIDQTED